jgi:hypothetical protein
MSIFYMEKYGCAHVRFGPAVCALELELLSSQFFNVHCSLPYLPNFALCLGAVARHMLLDLTS